MPLIKIYVPDQILIDKRYVSADICSSPGFGETATDLIHKITRTVQAIAVLNLKPSDITIYIIPVLMNDDQITVEISLFYDKPERTREIQSQVAGDIAQIVYESTFAIKYDDSRRSVEVVLQPFYPAEGIIVRKG